jgi:hypothetical protein
VDLAFRHPILGGATALLPLMLRHTAALEKAALAIRFGDT